jgi:DnaJ domain
MVTERPYHEKTSTHHLRFLPSNSTGGIIKLLSTRPVFHTKQALSFFLLLPSTMTITMRPFLSTTASVLIVLLAWSSSSSSSSSCFVVHGFTNNQYLVHHHHAKAPHRIHSLQQHQAHQAQKQQENDDMWFDDFRLFTGEVVNPYQVLKVDRKAERYEIRQQYLKMSRRYHPDAARQRDVLPGKW